MVIRSTTLHRFWCASLLALVVVGCSTPKRAETFPIIWDDDARDARTHHDETHQDAIPILAGPTVNDSFVEFGASGGWSLGFEFAPHAEENAAITGAVSASESSQTAEVLGLNVGYMLQDDFEIRLGYAQAAQTYSDNSYQGILIPHGDLESSDISIGFRHYVPTYRVRPYFGADYVLRSWDDLTGRRDSTDEDVRVSMDDHSLLAIEVGLRYLWNSSSSVQLGLRWMDPLGSADGEATYKDNAGNTVDDDLEGTHDSMRLMFGVNWLF